MSLGLDIDAEYGGHDALIDALALMRTPGEVHRARDGIHRSVMYRANVLTPNDPRHIPAGPIPQFFRRAAALCDARLAELTAEAVQARGGASADLGKME